MVEPPQKAGSSKLLGGEADDGSRTVAGRREVGKGRERVAAKETKEKREEEGFPSFFLFSPLAPRDFLLSFQTRLSLFPFLLFPSFFLYSNIY